MGDTNSHTAADYSPFLAPFGQSYTPLMSPHLLAMAQNLADGFSLDQPYSAFDDIAFNTKLAISTNFENSAALAHGSYLTPQTTPQLVSQVMSPLHMPMTPSQMIMGQQPFQPLAKNVADRYQPAGEENADYMGIRCNQDMSSGIKQRRNIHKDAEQKRRDTLKNGFDQLRKCLVIPIDSTYSKVALLQKGFSI